MNRAPAVRTDKFLSRVRVNIARRNRYASALVRGFELVVGYEMYVHDLEEAKGFVRDWVRLNASPVFDYHADIVVLQHDPVRARERADGRDRPEGTNHPGLYLPKERERLRKGRLS